MAADLIDLLPGSPRVLDLAIKASLILAAAGAAAMALRRSSAAARHLAWCLGLGGALVLPALSLALPAWSWRVLPSAEPDRPPPAAPARPTGSASSAPDPLDERTLDEEALVTVAPPGPPSGPTSPCPDSAAGPIVAHLDGAVVVARDHLAGRMPRHRVGPDRRAPRAATMGAAEADPIAGDDWTALLSDLSASLGLRRRVTLLRGALAAMPMTWGWLRPVILLPAESDAWDADRRRAVLLHELAHVKRFDGPTQAMARGACALYWFHPMAWYAARRMRVERERACDDVVLLAGARPSAYAGHLLEIARDLRVPRAASLAALAMERPSQLEGRLLAILDPARRRGNPGRGAAAIALLAAILALVPLATLHLGARAADFAAPTPAPIVDAAPPADPAAQMTLTGRVLDPSGRPVPGAEVMALVRMKYPDRPMLAYMNGPTSAHDGRCDDSGHFRIELPRTTSARREAPIVTALAPGYGVGWAVLDADADPPALDVALRPEQVVRGRLLDLNGRPAPGVVLRIRALGTAPGRVGESIYRPDFSKLRWQDRPAWPGPAISDADGRFTLRGLGRGLICPLIVDDPRFGLPLTFIQTDDAATPFPSRPPTSVIRVIRVEPGPDPKPIAIALQPARIITGRVTFADTGRPVPHALVSIPQRHREADAEGRFRIALTEVGHLGISATAPAGAPYLIASKQGQWPRGAVEQSIDLALPRGVVVGGRVVEEGTGRPVAGAIVVFTPQQRVARPPNDATSSGASATTGPDGTYQVAGQPGPGYVVVQGPSDDYVRREFGGSGGPMQMRPGRDRYYAHAYRAVNLKPGGPEMKVDLALRPGAAVPVRVVDRGEQPAPEALVFSRVIVNGLLLAGWRSWMSFPRERVRDGYYMLHGLEPGEEIPVFFLDPERTLGATARFSRRSGANGPATVRLEPCGTARARLVGPDGRPLTRYSAGTLVWMVVTPGPPSRSNAPTDGLLFADEAPAERFDAVNYPTGLQSDDQGRVTFPALIPGAPYRLVDYSPGAGQAGPQVRKEFAVKPGETIDLGDILIARPRRGD